MLSATIIIYVKDKIAKQRTQPVHETNDVQVNHAIQEALQAAEKQILEIPEKAAAMEAIVSRLQATVDTLKSDMKAEKQEKTVLKSTLEQKLQLVEEARKLLELNSAKEKGATWETRLQAESEQTGGHCTDGAWKLSREIEHAVKIQTDILYVRRPGNDLTFHEKLALLKDKRGLTNEEYGLLRSAWRIRNKISHDKDSQSSLEEGLILAKALNILQRPRAQASA
jgi:hypothetical protein